MSNELINSVLVSWEITLECNLKCRFCWLNLMKNTNPDYFRKIQYVPRSSVLNFGRKLFKLANKMNKQIYICWTGGEPLMRTDVLEISSIFKNRYRFSISLITNGLLLDQKTRNSLLDSIDILIVSIDGTRRTHNFLRNSIGCYEKVTKNIKQLVLDRKKTGSNLQIWTYMLLTPYNIKEIERYTKSMSQIGIDKILFRIFEWGDQTDSMYQKYGLKERYIPYLLQILNLKEKFSGSIAIDIDPQYMSRVIEYIKYGRVQPIPCYAGTHFFHINAIGNIYPCTKFSTHESPSILNIDEDIVQYYSSGYLKECFERMKRKQRLKVNPCKHCLYFHNFQIARLRNSLDQER